MENTIKKGIDVSYAQGNINWSKLKKAGVEFAMIREGFGRKEPKQIDKQFKNNIIGAQDNGIPHGIYHYSYAISVDDAVNEAQFCLENISGYKLEYPITFDIEDASMIKYGKTTLTNICIAFCNQIEKAGYYAMIYTNPNWLNNYLDKEVLTKRFDLWLAQWRVNAPSIPCGIWQTSENGRVDGIDGAVDTDISYRDYSQIMKSFGLNGFSCESDETETMPPDVIPRVPSLTGKTYLVKKGDNLWDIAKSNLGGGQKYIDIKKLNNLTSDVIYPGQILKLSQ